MKPSFNSQVNSPISQNRNRISLDYAKIQLFITKQ
jgi:hypothetical protein